MKKVKVKSKKVTVYENLKKRIISCEFPPGMPINEADFAANLGVSKTPIREALRQLERDGLVENVPGRGSLISHISSNDISGIFELREILECGAASRAALLEDKSGLEKKLAEIQELSGNTQNIPERVHAWGYWEDVHEAIVNALGNQKLSEMYQGLMDHIKRIRNHIGKRYTQRRLDEIMSEHLEILNAIVKGDPERSERAVQYHLNNAVSFVTGVVPGPKG
jgi:DNA-binding GntR family transcriptional regulator